MPPKKGATSAPSKKTEQKKKDKVVEDKTFGLKNKKGAKQQKFIQQVQKQVQFGGNPSARKMEAAKLAEKDKKKPEDDPLMSTLFKPVTQAQKIEKGADPKSVLCAFFKQGTCGKGDKCKFSHDLTIERKAEKRSLYCDMRDDGEVADTMDQWDEAKLQEVVDKKHGATNKTKPQTDIICKYFLDAVEKSKYGWFWECPSGENCHYRHALPPGFVLKKDKLAKDAKKDEISLEDLIERERSALGSSLTKITLETFTHWKKRKIQERKDAMQKDEDKKRAEFRAGRQVGLSGREMFTFNPLMAVDSDQLEDGDDTFDTRNLPGDEEEDDTQEYKEISFDQLEMEAQEVDDSSCTVAANDRMERLKITSPESEAGGTGDASSSNNVDVPIDENLFEDSDLPDSDDDDDEDDDNDESQNS